MLEEVKGGMKTVSHKIDNTIKGIKIIKYIYNGYFEVFIK